MTPSKTSRRLGRLSSVAFSSAVSALIPRAFGVVTYGTGNNFNFSAAPQNALLNYEGEFGAYTGTTIGSQYLLTATHTNPGATASFAFNNGTGTTTNYNIQEVASIDDVSVWQIVPSTTATFATYAPLYTGNAEVGASVVDIGRGVTRGGAVTGGWAWGGFLNVSNPFSWGTNTVSAIDPAAQVQAPYGDGGDYLQTDFNNNSSNPNESMNTVGDSGGGLFINNNGVYQLAGLNSLIEEAEDANGNYLPYSLYDAYGYYQTDASGNFGQITTHTPLSSYATRISSKVNFISAVTGATSPIQDAISPIVSNGTVQIFQSVTTGAVIGGAALAVGSASSYTTLTIAPYSGASVVSSLAIDINSTLDLNNNAIFIDYGWFLDPRAQIVAKLASGYHGGLWNGFGIQSSMAASEHGYGIGYADSADRLDPSLTSGQLEIAYTLYGDINLQGSVTGLDLSILAGNFGKNVTGGWAQGDLTYSGSVNSSDFSLLAHNFGRSAIYSDFVIPASAWAALDAFAAAHGLTSDIPEPTFIPVAIASVLTVVYRRRRRLPISKTPVADISIKQH